MKRFLKSVVSLLLAAVIFAAGLPVYADEAASLKSKVYYSDDGIAFVEITPSDSDNEVRFTTDGSVPTVDSALYRKPIQINVKTVIRMAEFNEDGEKVKGIKRTVTPKTGKVSFDVKQSGDGEAYVTITCATEGAEIRYTTDGSKPSRDSELYTGTITITAKTKFRARAYMDGYKTTTTYGKTVKIVFEEPEPEVTTPEVKEQPEETAPAETEEKTETEAKETKVEKDADEATVTEKVSYKTTFAAEKGCTYVTLNKKSASNVIYYTIDGSVPNKDSKKYSSRVKITEPCVFRAKEYSKSGKLVATIKVNVTLKCAPVTFTCIGMAIGTKTIEMKTDTEGAEIRYTLDGSQPNENSTLYTGPTSFGDITAVRAIAFKDGYKKSSITTDIAGAIPYVQKDFDFSDPNYEAAAERFARYFNGISFSAPVLDETLTRAASVRAEELTLLFDHKRPTGYAYSSVFYDNGMNPSFAYEIIIAGKDSATEAIDEIMKVDEYRKEIFENGVKYEKIGIGYRKKGDITYWAILLLRE